MTTDDKDDPILEAMWTSVLADWSDDKKHAALLDYALRNEKLPILAGNYRALQDDPDKAAVSKKKLDAIVVAATQMLMSMKTPKPTRHPAWLNATAGVIALILIGWIVYAMTKH